MTPQSVTVRSTVSKSSGFDSPTKFVVDDRSPQTARDWTRVNLTTIQESEHGEPRSARLPPNTARSGTVVSSERKLSGSKRE